MFTGVRVVRDIPAGAKAWRNAPEVHVAYEKGIGDTGTATILGTSYPTVVMPDGLEWMTANLAYAGVGQWWNSAASDDGDGRYYTRAEALALTLPEGWRLPTEAEILALGAAVGGMSVAGKVLKAPGTTYWATDTGAMDALGFALHGSGRYWGEWQTKRTAAFLWLGGAGKPYWGVDDNASPLWVGTDGTHTTWRCPLRLVRDVSRQWRKATRVFKAAGTVDPGTPGTASILGTTYPTVVMPDGREWMAANLAWDGAGVWWNNGASDDGDGRYYNLYAPTDPPSGVGATDPAAVKAALVGTGWRIPTQADALALDAACAAIVGPANVGGALKVTDEWTAPNTGATNQFGFNARPSGRYYSTWETKTTRGYFGLDAVSPVRTAVLLENSADFLPDVDQSAGGLGVTFRVPYRLVRDIPGDLRTWREVTT